MRRLRCGICFACPASESQSIPGCMYKRWGVGGCFLSCTRQGKANVYWQGGPRRCGCGWLPNGQQAAMKQVLCSADDKLSNSLPTTSHVGRDKAGPLWPLPTKRRAQSHGRAALGASSKQQQQQQIRRAGLRAIEPPVVMLGTSRGMTSVV